MTAISRVYTLSAAELVARIRQKLLMEPVDEAVSRTDSPGALLRMELLIADAYAEGLLTLPIAQLPITDLTSDALLSDPRPGQPASLLLPARCLRPVAVRMAGWSRDATIVEAGSPLALAQDNPFSRGGSASPVAVVEPGARLTLYTPPPSISPTLLTFLAIALPSEGIYPLTAPLEAYILTRLSTHLS